MWHTIQSSTDIFYATYTELAKSGKCCYFLHKFQKHQNFQFIYVSIIYTLDTAWPVTTAFRAHCYEDLWVPIVCCYDIT
jgi:hypothetical protein